LASEKIKGSMNRKKEDVCWGDRKERRSTPQDGRMGKRGNVKAKKESSRPKEDGHKKAPSA